MARKVFDDVSSAAIEESGSGENWVFSRESYVGVADGAALTISGSSNHYAFSGGLFSADAEACAVTGNDNSITVGKGAVLGGEGPALSLAGSGLTAVNHGLLYGSIVDPNGAGTVHIGAHGGQLTNDGTISARGYGVGTEGGNVVITNDKGGEIAGAFGILLSGAGHSRIVNEGSIHGSSEALAAEDGRDKITNHGDMAGTVDLGGGGDTLDTRGGTIEGSIFGGSGDDVLFTDKAGYHLAEDAGGGSDTVKSTVSYRLNANVEELDLLGKADIDGIGNSDPDTANVLRGNAGDNVLEGRGGHNEFFGGAGRDTLKGGSDVDIFHFAKGCDRDIITNYTDVGDATHGKDRISIDGFKGVTHFADIKADLSQHGRDVWLDMGHDDVLVIRHATVEAFGPSDFIFG